MKKIIKTPEPKTLFHQIVKPAAKGKRNEEQAIEPVNVMEEELPFMYETKNAEYVFGAELNDGFVTLTMPKDRFTSQPEVLHVKVELIN